MLKRPRPTPDDWVPLMNIPVKDLNDPVPKTCVEQFCRLSFFSTKTFILNIVVKIVCLFEIGRY